jgi:DNA modification methylase
VDLSELRDGMEAKRDVVRQFLHAALATRPGYRRLRRAIIAQVQPYYEHSGITIYHGDCREVLPELGRFDLLLTDPPYGIRAARRDFGGNGVKRHMTGLVAGKAIPKRDYGDAAWDDVACPQDLLDSAISSTTDQIIWGGNYFDLGPARCYLVWDKLRGDTDYADAEIAWTSFDRSIRVIRWRWNGFLQQNSGDDKEERWHPTQKPLSVMAWALKQAPETIASVLDPWMGSGTTLVAAKAAGIAGVGIEIEERYCEMAARRLSQEVLAFT